MKHILTTFFAGISLFCFGQDTAVLVTSNNIANPAEVNEQVYKLKPAIDIPVTGVLAGWSLYAFPRIYSKDPSTESQINALDVNDINGFDRWAADIYSEDAAQVSDLLFYGAMPLPLLLLADKEIRKDAGKVGFLFLETMSVTGLFYTGSLSIWDRYRPLAYNPEVPMEERTRGGSKNSFIGGHPALVGSSTFFIAKVYADYHPESKLKYYLYGAAAAATGTTAYLRHRGGKHFPSDLIVGTSIGVLSGILVPHWHKVNKNSKHDYSVVPFTGESHGLSFVYRFK